MTPRRILIVGAGGREHALARRLAQDAGVEVMLAPGSAAAADQFPRVLDRDLGADTIADQAERRGVTLVVIGPEQYLADGLSDTLAARGIPVFGPTREAARLESSKWFAKTILDARRIPTARAERCETEADLDEALKQFRAPYVVKAEGLEAGKGVLVTSQLVEARSFGRRFLGPGASGPKAVLVEEFMRGQEATVMAVTDGREFVLLPPARDYKRVGDGDHGPNTGGMGAFAPTSAVGARVEDEVAARIVRPALEEMAARGTPFRGVLYCGLMLTDSGPQVIEFNARFGDPETQVVLPLVAGDFTRLLASAAAGRLEPQSVGRQAGACVTVALVDEGYPEASRGGAIEGLDTIARDPEIQVLGAGIERDGECWKLTGGRGAYVTARGATLKEARERVYAAIARLGGTGWKYRTDIAAAPAAVAARG